MRKGLVIVLGLWLLAGVGCGPSPESLVQQQIAAMKQIAGILGDIRDDASADAALPRLEKAVNHLNALDEQMKGKRMSKEEAEQLRTRYGQQLADAGADMKSAAQGARSRAPGRGEQIQELIAKVRAKTG